MLTAQSYGCASRPDIEPLATIFRDALTLNYFDAAGAAAEADASAAGLAFFAFFIFLAFGAGAEASVAAAGVEAAGASAAKAETANIPAIKAAIRFFILRSFNEIKKTKIRSNQCN